MTNEKLTPLAAALRWAVLGEMAGCGMATSIERWNLVAAMIERPSVEPYETRLKRLAGQDENGVPDGSLQENRS